MKVAEEMVMNIADLAKLHLEEEEKCSIVKELEKSFEFIDKLKEIDVTGVEPTEQMSSACNVFREDESGPSYDRDVILSMAPDSDGGCYRVPRVVE